MPPCAADYTNTFRSLSSITAEPSSEEAEGGLPPALAEVLGPLDEVRSGIQVQCHPADSITKDFVLKPYQHTEMHTVPLLRRHKLLLQELPPAVRH